MKHHFATLAATSVAFFAASPVFASSWFNLFPGNGPNAFSRQTACMVEALKTVDKVTAPSDGTVQGPSAKPLPFVRYTYPRRSDHRPTTITFIASGDLNQPATVQYVATLNGLFSPKDAGPDVYGATAIFKLWKARCGVTGNIRFP